MALSQRTSQHDAPNALARELAAARARGAEVLDLTVSNPTAAGLPYCEERILAALTSPGALAYEPQPLGLPAARAAVAEHYAAVGVELPASRIALTASTSEAYAVLFKLLCDPGDELLVPAPSYPLLGWLAAFESVRLRPYPLVYACGWHVDVDALRAAVGPRTRGVVVVSPNNPTGSYLARHELDAMLELGLPVISDEVFAPYPLGPLPAGRLRTVLGEERGLLFSLSGLSKLAGLPQMKLGWIGVGGAPERVEEAMRRLELVLDAYLSVGAPVQHALPGLLAAGESTRAAIAARTRANLAHLRELARASEATTLLDVEGGWYATLRVPETRSDEEWATLLVREDAVHVHPGYFFDMHRGAHLVVSLLTPEALLHEGAARLCARVASG